MAIVAAAIAMGHAKHTVPVVVLMAVGMSRRGLVAMHVLPPALVFVLYHVPGLVVKHVLMVQLSFQLDNYD